jgi:hypothetical protein
VVYVQIRRRNIILIFFILSLYLLASCIQEVEKPIGCTLDAKICPDGSAVGRIPPDCEFAPCPTIPSPTVIASTSTTLSTFQTYTTTTIKPVYPIIYLDPNKIQAKVYKSPATCRCCDRYFDYLRAKGFQLEVVGTPDMSSVYLDYLIEHDMQSCHTTLIGDYFIEGHVPIEAIDMLLTEKPAIEGISLPGTPYGAPGMRGAKTKAFTIYSISEGEESVFLIQ